VNKDGFLSLEEFRNLIEKKQRHYPQLEQYGKKISEMFVEADINKDEKIRYYYWSVIHFVCYLYAILAWTNSRRSSPK
jgi:hypothetical protein